MSVVESVERCADPAAERVRLADAEYVLRWAYQSADVPAAVHDVAARALGRPSLAHGFGPSTWPISRDGMLVCPGMSVRVPPHPGRLLVESVTCAADAHDDFPGGYIVQGGQFVRGVAEVFVSDPPAAGMPAVELAYLATPYSHDNPAVMAERFDVVNRVAAELFRDGVHVFSPIGHTHPMAAAVELPTDWKFWADNCRLMISKCDRLIVLQVDGWTTSVGVSAEIEIAKELGLPVEFMRPAVPADPVAAVPELRRCCRKCRHVLPESWRGSWCPDCGRGLQDPDDVVLQDAQDVVLPRLCERCRKPVEPGCEFAWCESCGVAVRCVHGADVADCNQCAVESDLAFDAARESL